MASALTNILLNYTLCQASCGGSVSFRELTGAYSATNTGGWGSPNETTGDAVTAVLIFEDPNGTVYSSLDVTAYSFPKTDTITATEITAATVDSTLTKFVDGFWKITYVVTTGTTTYSHEQTFFFYATLRKQLCDLVKVMEVCDCNCDYDSLNKVLQYHAYFDALCYAVKIGDTESVNEIFSTLTNLINCTTC